MSREQRRADRKNQQARAGAPPPSRRTPVQVGGESRFPALTLGIAAGIIIVAGLLVYLIIQSGSGGPDVDAATKAEQDDSASIPGTFYPTQGRGHFPGGLNGHQMTPYCAGVATSESAKLTIVGGNGTPSGSATSAPTGTPVPSSTPATPISHGTVNTTPTVPTNCFTSNPPSSGQHLNVQRNIDVGGGNIINIPADPDVYPDDVEMPRDAIPHTLEHAGVFVGWNCASGDTACTDAAQKLKDLVNDRIDNNDNRVVMAHDNDLPEGTFGLASWTRVLTINANDWENQKGEAERFISRNSCRFDPEGFCR